MKISEKIIEILSKELEIESDSIDKSDPYSSLENMDSMTQVSITNIIEQEFEIEFDFDDLFDIEIVEDLIQIVNDKLN
jgi:acyl carrier protein